MGESAIAQLRMGCSTTAIVRCATIVIALSCYVAPTICIAQPVTTHYNPDEQPRLVVSDSGRFRILLPAGFPEPTKSADRFSDDYPDLMLQKLVSVMGNQRCVITYLDVPEEIPIQDSLTAEVFLRANQNGVIETLKGTIIDQHALVIQPSPEYLYTSSIPGRRFRFRYTSDRKHFFAHHDIFIAGRRVYNVCYYCPSRKLLDSKRTQQYFESFRVTSP